MQALKRHCGWSGVGRWWALLEMCVEKMEKEPDEEYTDAHCRFEFDIEYLRVTLGFGNTHQTLTYLARLADLGLTYFERQGDVAVTSIPKILEYLDRDARYTRKQREPNASKNKNEELDKEIKKKNENENVDALQDIAKAFSDTFDKIPIITKELIVSKYTQEFIFDYGPELYAYWRSQPQSRNFSYGDWGAKFQSGFRSQADWLEKQFANQQKFKTGNATDSLCGLAKG